MGDLTIEVALDGTVLKLDLGDAVDINEADLSAEFSKQASLLAYWGTLLEQAQNLHRRQDDRVESYAAELSLRIRKRAAASGEKTTEGKISDEIKNDVGYRKSKENLLDAKHEVEQLKVALRALEEKGKMLISLGAQKRAELDMTGMRIMEKT